MPDVDLFFSLARFAHREIWQQGYALWTPIQLLNEYLNSLSHSIESKPSSKVHMECPELITIGKNTVIEAGVYIEGPCVIGSHCIIRHGAYLHGGFLCGDGCVIGHSSEIKHSILLDHAAATHFTYVGDSILGNRVNLGAGVKCANLRLDRQEVTILWKGERMNTGLKKFGALIGDSAQIGCNCVINPGTLVGRGSIAHPLLNFGGTIAPESRILSEGHCKISPLIEPLFQSIGSQHAP